MSLESATSALHQHAGSSWDSPMAPRAGRAEALKSRALEASRQEALARTSAGRKTRRGALVNCANINFNVAGFQQDFRDNQSSQQQFQKQMLA